MHQAVFLKPFAPEGQPRIRSSDKPSRADSGTGALTRRVAGKSVQKHTAMGIGSTDTGMRASETLCLNGIVQSIGQPWRDERAWRAALTPPPCDSLRSVFYALLSHRPAHQVTHSAPASSTWAAASPDEQVVSGKARGSHALESAPTQMQSPLVYLKYALGATAGVQPLSRHARCHTHHRQRGGPAHAAAGARTDRGGLFHAGLFQVRRVRVLQSVLLLHRGTAVRSGRGAEVAFRHLDGGRRQRRSDRRRVPGADGGGTHPPDQSPVVCPGTGGRLCEVGARGGRVRFVARSAAADVPASAVHRGQVCGVRDHHRGDLSRAGTTRHHQRRSEWRSAQRIIAAGWVVCGCGRGGELAAGRYGAERTEQRGGRQRTAHPARVGRARAVSRHGRSRHHGHDAHRGAVWHLRLHQPTTGVEEVMPREATHSRSRCVSVAARSSPRAPAGYTPRKCPTPAARAVVAPAAAPALAYPTRPEAFRWWCSRRRVSPTRPPALHPGRRADGRGGAPPPVAPRSAAASPRARKSLPVAPALQCGGRDSSWRPLCSAVWVRDLRDCGAKRSGQSAASPV
eukprot:ctg_285.g185